MRYISRCSICVCYVLVKQDVICFILYFLLFLSFLSFLFLIRIQFNGSEIALFLLLYH